MAKSGRAWALALIAGAALASCAARARADESGFFESDGLRIHYETFGEGRPIVLVHGWGVDLRKNWVESGWVEALRPLRRVVALDVRGHGKSAKPHEQALYGYATMARDVVHLLDRLGIEKADFLGYSMGAFMGAHLLGHEGRRFGAMVLGGIGDETEQTKDASSIALALRAKDPSKIANPVGLAYRMFVAADPQNDLEALALSALQMWPEGYPLALGGAGLAKAENPVLIVDGENDHYALSAGKLAAAIPGAKLVTIPGADHLSAVKDERFKRAVVDFLKAH